MVARYIKNFYNDDPIYIDEQLTFKLFTLSTLIKEPQLAFLTVSEYS